MNMTYDTLRYQREEVLRYTGASASYLSDFRLVHYSTQYYTQLQYCYSTHNIYLYTYYV